MDNENNRNKRRSGGSTPKNTPAKKSRGSGKDGSAGGGQPVSFKLIRENITAREAAEHYGIRSTYSGMARCPFHDDHVPSLKLDKRFHCFGCGADGDAIDFVARLFGLSKREAAEKLAKDFGLRGKNMTADEWREIRAEKRLQELMLRYPAVESGFYRALGRKYHAALRIAEERAPKDPREEPDPAYCEAVKDLPLLEHMLDRFLDAGLKERIDMINEYGKKVAGVE